MKKIDLKLLLVTVFVFLLAAYALPYTIVSGWAIEIGYPFSWMTIYNPFINTSFLRSAAVNMFAVAVDLLLIYLLVLGVSKGVSHLRRVRKS